MAEHPTHSPLYRSGPFRRSGTRCSLFLFDYVQRRMVAPESAIDPEDDQGHIERHRKDEKGNRVEERLVAQCGQDGAADGFNIMPPLLPAQLDVFSAEVIPILQRRRLFRTEYQGSRLREHYGLPWPKSVFDDPAWTAEPLNAVAGV
jgi:hypothetical protein